VDITEGNVAVEDIRWYAAALEAFHDLGKRLRTAGTAEEMHPVLLGHASRLLRADHGAFALLNPDHTTFMRVHVLGTPAEERGSTFPMVRTPWGRVVETGVSFVTADFATTLPAGRGLTRDQHRGPLVIVPVRIEEEVIGTIDLGRAQKVGTRPFADAEVRVLESIAEIGGAAIDRARLHRKLQQTYVQMVLALAESVESRDSHSAEHGDRMAALAAHIGRALGCSDGEMQDIRWGARLQDIGKSGVPDTILSKPGSLTEGEWMAMRQHPVLGEEILNSVEQMRGVAKLVRHHQEKWDGTGYPDGLKGESIPLGSRILAVVDAYGAITDARPYKSAWTRAEAVAEIRRCAGSQFDPDVVEAFCRILEDVVE
jgi:HD domain/GAF domain